MSDSKIVTYLKDLGKNLLHFIDPRVLIALGVFLVGWYFLADTIKAIVSTGFAFLPSIAIATLICLVVRKVMLNGKFDLQEHADSAKGGNIASAIVFAVVIALMVFVFWRVHSSFSI